MINLKPRLGGPRGPAVLNHLIISPLCLHVRQAKLCWRVCEVFFSRILPFSRHLLIGPSHMSSRLFQLYIGIYIYQQRNVLQTSHSNKARLENLPCTRTITFETLYKPSEIFVIHFYMVLFVSVYVPNSQFVCPASFLFLFPC